MSEREYRQDDQTVGYCPKCGKQLANLTVGLRGYCEQHGWTFADFDDGRDVRHEQLRRRLGDDEYEYLRTEAKIEAAENA